MIQGRFPVIKHQQNISPARAQRMQWWQDTRTLTIPAIAIVGKVNRS